MTTATSVNRKPGRPSLSKAEREAIRQTIIEIARELFVNEGYENTSMRKIAAQAGFAPTKIYYYFENKKAILRHFWQDIANELWQFCKPDVSLLEGCPLELLRHIMYRTVEYWLTHPRSYQLGIATQDFSAQASENMAIYEIEGTKQYVKLLRSTVQRCIDLGIFKADDNVRCAQLISMSIYGIYGSFYGLPMVDWEDKQSLIRNSIENTLAGLQSRNLD